MSKLLEIFGRAVTVNTADLIWYWLTAVRGESETDTDLKIADFNEIIDLIGKLDLDTAEEKLKSRPIIIPRAIFKATRGLNGPLGTMAKSTMNTSDTF